MKLQAITRESKHIKQLFSFLKSQLDYLELSIDSHGFSITTLDVSHTMSIDVLLKASQFDVYECPDPLTICVSLKRLEHTLKNLEKDDMLTFLAEDTPDGGPLGLKIKINKPKTKKGREIEFFIPPSIDDCCDGFVREDADYPLTLRLSSTDFSSVVKSLKSTDSKLVRLIYSDGKLILGTNSLETEAKSVIEGDDLLVARNNLAADESITLYLGLNKLSEFSKCGSISDFVSIELRNANDPIFLEYDVGKLGKIKLGLSTHADPEM